jgi:hypothetical protein
MSWYECVIGPIQILRQVMSPIHNRIGLFGLAPQCKFSILHVVSCDTYCVQDNLQSPDSVQYHLYPSFPMLVPHLLNHSSIASRIREWIIQVLHFAECQKLQCVLTAVHSYCPADAPAENQSLHPRTSAFMPDKNLRLFD